MPFTPPTPINIGSYANDGTGDDLRTAFEKVNANFTLINSQLGVTNAENIGSSGFGVFAGKTDNALQFKKLTGSGGVVITATDTNINIEGLKDIQGDTSPTLGGNLDLNGYLVYGQGDVQSTVWGLDVRTINAQVQALVGNDVDFGFFTAPTAINIDFGTF